jgi:hypothetical protein
MATTAIDQSRLEAFMGQAVVDLARRPGRAAIYGSVTYCARNERAEPVSRR